MKIDHLQHRLEQAMFYYGTRAGIPFDVLGAVADAGSVLRRPLDTLRRKDLARDIVRHSKWANFMPRDKGFAALAPGQLPGMEEAIAAGRAIYDKRVAGEIAKKPNNPFYPLAKREDLLEHRAILDFALSEAVIETVTGYFGEVPKLGYADVWLTRPSGKDQPFHSQLFHLDKPDTKIATVFLNVSDVKPENGPFSFVPADVSDAVCKATHYKEAYQNNTASKAEVEGRLTDEQLFAHCDRDSLIELVGQGNGGFVDTSTCMHYGSRCREGERVVVVIRFLQSRRTRYNTRDLYAGHPYGADPVRRLVLEESTPAA